MNGFEDIFTDEGSEQPAEAVQPEVVVEATPEPVERDEKGRFAPKGEEGVSPTPVEEAPPLEHPALLGERRRRQEAEARIAELEARVNTPQQAPQPVEIPDPIVDPEGFNQVLQQQLDSTRYQDRLYYSGQMATLKHGESLVKEALDWGMRRCDTDAHFNAKVRGQIDPIGLVVEEYRRDQIASKVTWEDYEELKRLRAEKATPAPVDPAIPALPDSLADAGAGRAPAAQSNAPALLSLDQILGGR